VVDPVDIEPVAGDQHVVEGGSARLTCRATGFPKPKVRWERKGEDSYISQFNPRNMRKVDGERVHNRRRSLLTVEEFLGYHNGGHIVTRLR